MSSIEQEATTAVKDCKEDSATPATTPEQVHRLWEAAFAAKDIQALIALYAPGAVMSPAPGETLVGREAIQASLEKAFARGLVFRMQASKALCTGDVALVATPWTIEGATGPGASGVTADVLRLQADARWLIEIDCPFGGAWPLPEAMAAASVMTEEAPANGRQAAEAADSRGTRTRLRP